MNNRRKKTEDIRNLAEKFYSADEVPEVCKDIRSGDELFARSGDLQPPAELNSSIKAQIAEKLSTEQKSNASAMIIKWALTAAAVIVVVLVVNPERVNDDSQITDVSQQSSEVSWSNFETGQDSELAFLSHQMDDIASLLRSVNMDEGKNGYSRASDTADELEKELIETETIFWKG